MVLSALKRCIEVSDAMIADAVVSRKATKALLERMAEIARPGEGAPKILLVFAKMATSAEDWLEGDLRVEVIGDGDVSVFEVMTDLGAGLRERALPSFVVNVPLSEFAGAVQRVPRMIQPLILKTKSDRRLVFVSGEDAGGPTLLPPPVSIADEHLVVIVPATMSAAPQPVEQGGVEEEGVDEERAEEPVTTRGGEEKPEPTPKSEEEDAIDGGWD